MDPNEHNTQRIKNEAIKKNRTVEHFWDVLVFDVIFRQRRMIAPLPRINYG